MFEFDYSWTVFLLYPIGPLSLDVGGRFVATGKKDLQGIGRVILSSSGKYACNVGCFSIVTAKD